MKRSAAILLFVFVVCFADTGFAQCAMCRAALQGSENIKQAEAVNDGIVYLMILPYLMVGIVGFVVYRTLAKVKKPGI